MPATISYNILRFGKKSYIDAVRAGMHAFPGFLRRFAGASQMTRTIDCDECGLAAEVTLRPASGLPLAAAQRDIEQMLESEVRRRCRRSGAPGACPNFQRAIETAIEAGQFTA